MTSQPARTAVTQALKELTTVMKQLTLFTTCMDSLTVFIISLLATTILSMPWHWAFAALVIYALIHTYRSFRTLKIIAVEDKVPPLQERLRTVADNLDKENEITNSLNEEVLKLMKDVRTSYFLSFGRLTRELIVMAVVAFLIIGLSAYNVTLLDYKKGIDYFKDAIKPLTRYTINPEDLIFNETNATENIYGNKSIAQLGTKELNLQINPSLSDIDISKQGNLKPREFKEVPPREISAQTDKTYTETIQKDYQKIVKNYFSEITKER